MSATAIAPHLASSAASTGTSRKGPAASRVELLTFQSAPVFYAVGCFAAGATLSRVFYRSPALLWLIAVLMAMVVLIALRLAPRVALAALCVAWVVAGIFCAEIHPWPDPQTSLLSYASGAAYTVQGEVVRAGPARVVESTAPFASRSVAEKSQVVDLAIRQISDSGTSAKAVDGGLRLTLYAPAETPFPGFSCGQELRLAVSIHRPERYNDPGVWDSAAYLLGQGISVLGSAKAASVMVVAAHRPPLACALKAIQQAASERVMLLGMPDSAAWPRWSFLRLTREDASMLAAMVTGDRSWLQRHTRIGFERTGSFHLLVVSGLHLAIFAGLIFWLAQRVRLPRAAASLVTILASLAYALLTGFGQPVQRSFWMVTLYLLARLLWRERNPVNAIGFAALCLLAADPLSLFEAGFQMTLLSVIAIAGIAAPLGERSFAPYLRGARNLSLLAIDPSLPPRVAQFRVSLRLLGTHLEPLTGRRLAFQGPAVAVRLALRVVELMLISVVVEIVMSLPMALYFHRVTALALPVNLFILPVLGVLLPSALLTFAASLISIPLAAIPAAATAALLHSVAAPIGVFAAMRAGDIRIPGPSPAATAAYVFLLIAAVYTARLRRFAPAVCAILLALMAASVLLPRPISRNPGMLEITAIDVGQGDALLVVTPDDKTLLVDAGGSPFGPPPGVANFDIGEEVVSAYLWSRGIRRLDGIALTHAHADHIGGMPAVIEDFRPREVWIGNSPHSQAYDAFLAESGWVGAVLKHHVAGDHFQFGSTRIEVLAPEEGYRPGPVPSNNDSLVLRVVYRETSALLEGDAEAPSEQRMVVAGGLHSDLLKVGHHGSRTSTTPPFLAAVAPSFAMISVGSRNLYGHPRREVLEELQADRVRTFRTDTLGVSSVYLDGNRVKVGLFPAIAN